MKLLTLNFLTCAIKKCKQSPLSYPLHFKDVEIIIDDDHHHQDCLPGKDDDRDGDKTRMRQADGDEAGQGRQGEESKKDTGRERKEEEFNADFIKNILPRLDWDALRVNCLEIGITTLPATKPTFNPTPFSSSSSNPFIEESSSSKMDLDEDQHDDDEDKVPVQEKEKEKKKEEMEILRDLNRILTRITIKSGYLVCGNCGHEYSIREGVCNFLVPPHLV